MVQARRIRRMEEKPMEETETLHQRFFVLAGLVRHEYWLHGQAAEAWGFFADPDTLTLRARKQRNSQSECRMQVTEELLADDLQALARHFYKELCNGHGPLGHERRRQRR
jgi:hypothetical protein